MNYRRAVCIYNPASGRGVSQSQLETVRQILSASAANVRLAPTGLPGHATELARQAAIEGCDLVAVCSGDGTVNEVVQGLAGRGPTALLVLPGGTANVLINELGLPADPIRAARLLPHLVAKPVRLGRAAFSNDGSSRYFLLMCGAGLDAAIADRVSQPLKRTMGRAAFWLAGAQFFLERFPRVRVSTADSSKTNPWCGLVVVSKSRLYGGGLVLAPRAHLLADHFVTAQFPGANRLVYSSYLTAARCHLLSRWPGVRLEAHSDLVLEPAAGEPVQVQVDGEVIGELPARITLSDVTCTILMPMGYVTN
jgi:diacylglycerol kinase family enzyme